MCNGNCNRCGVVKKDNSEQIEKLNRLWERLATKEALLEDEINSIKMKRYDIEEEICNLELN